MFNINAVALPTLRTRQALLILDLQNDFVSPDGPLTINQPDVIVSRIVQLAKAFRLSGAGDVIWIRSQYDGHRPLSGGVDGGDQIITTDAPVVPRRTTSSRGRLPTSGRHEEAVMEADEEAFLSYPPGSEKPKCVRPDSGGAQLVDEVQQAVDSGRDITFTKTHYSAFAAGQQLLQLLRGRFVTEIYLCGALTNISIYATALDAGRHGYDITLIDDCCGYRSDMRHSNAVHRLMQLTGCELKPERPSSEEKAVRRSRGQRKAPAPSPTQSIETAGLPQNRGKESAVGQPSPEDEGDVSNALPSSFEKLTLSGEPSSAPAASSGSHAQPNRQNPSPTAQQPLQKSSPLATASPGHQIQHVDSAPLEVDPELSAEPTSPSGVHSDDSQRREQLDIARRLSYLRTNKARGPPRVLIPANSSLAAGSAARSAAAKAKMRSRKPPNDEPTAGASTGEVADSENNKESTKLKIDEQQSRTPANPTSSKPLCEGDTTIISNLLPPSLAATAFERLQSEVAWQRMSHQGGEVPRLVAVQGEVDDEGNMPAYRHPSDESPPLLPFSPTVAEIKAEVEKQVGHPLNHVLIQFYRDGNDYISEHSDKTLDIARDSFIANVSLGAERTMVFRTKRLDKDPSRKHGKATAPLQSPGDAAPSPDETTGETSPEPTLSRRIERASLPHNSLCRMGLATNMRWLHAIRQDKRLDREKSEAELAYGGQRISLTFRRIATFLDKSQSRIWGQGAVAKSKDAARPVINGQTPEAVAMLRAFGAENHSSDFEWGRFYGEGFDVLNIKAAPRLFASADRVVNMRVAMMLAEFGVSYAKGSTGAEGTGNEASIKFVDNDAAKSTVGGQMAVMLYLDAVYSGSKRNEPPVPQDELARRLTRFQAALGLLDKWRVFLASLADQGGSSSVTGAGPSSWDRLTALGREMDVWDGYARDAAAAAAGAESSAKGYIAGGERPSIADFALWPVLHDIMVTQPGSSKAGVKVLGGDEVRDESAAAPTE
ncbi:hypothetical protein BR93DRAFT_953972 [Coniochaeta sp. PMI_546]|nr:hypothetical protein BR93DRAFT_953972 [Coniochaeta sp. PMI_546]